MRDVNIFEAERERGCFKNARDLRLARRVVQAVGQSLGETAKIGFEACDLEELQSGIADFII